MIASSPAFHPHDKVIEEQGIQIVKAIGNLWQRDPLLWNISGLNEFDHWQAIPMSFHFASIDEMLAKSSIKDAARVDQVLYDYLSDFAAIAEGLASLKYHSHFEPSTSYDMDADLSTPMDFGESAGILQKCVTESAEEYDKIWAKLEELRNMPKPSSQITRRSVMQTEHLHKALDAFWRQVRDIKTP